MIKKLLIIILFINITYGDTNLAIYSDYNKSLEVAQKENKPLFILFSKPDCQWCKKLKSKIATDINMTKRLQKEFIVLFLDKQSDKYPSKYKIQAVPDVFLVSPKEEIYTEILGYHSKSKDYFKWFDYVRIEREEI